MLLVVGLLVAGVWVASGWWRVGFGSKHREGHVVQGRARVLTYTFFTRDPWNRGWSFSRSQRSSGGPRWSWVALDEEDDYWLKHTNFWFASFTEYNANDPSGDRCFAYDVVLWPIPFLLWIPAALLLRSGILARRRASTGMCVKCGYSLAGLADGAACPECGKGAGTV